MTCLYDQARRLRELMREIDSTPRPGVGQPPVVTVVGGCSADCASLIAASLADELARQAVSVQFQSSDSPSRIESDDVEIKLVDAGVGFTPISAPIWREADLVLAVASSSRESLMATYVALKSAMTAHPHTTVRFVPSQCADGRAADDLHRRISASCERFLGRAIQAAPWLPCTLMGRRSRLEGEPIRRLAEFIRCQVLQRVEGRQFKLGP